MICGCGEWHWKKCGHPRTPENTCGVLPNRPAGQCRQCQRAVWVRYRHSEKGREAYARYEDSEKGRAGQKRYRLSEKGRVSNRRSQARYSNTISGQVSKVRRDIKYGAKRRGTS